MATAPPPTVRERTTRPRLIFFTSAVSGQCRRAEGFLAQVLQRRHNHDTFRVVVVDDGERPDVVRRFKIGAVPALVVVDGRTERARLERPRGCREIEELLGPWLR